MNALEIYTEWTREPTLSAELKAELTSISGDTQAIEERFFRDLEFGTAGLRAVMGAGANRMNAPVVRRATMGLCLTLLDMDEAAKQRGIAIAHDSRIGSREFAVCAAEVIAANGIKAYLFDSLRSVPELSFAVRDLKTAAGIMITASHNPKEYNGYKVFDETGAQLGIELSDKVTKRIDSLHMFRDVRSLPESEARANGLIVSLGEDMDRRYLETVKKLCVSPELIAEAGDFTVVYTPLHGSGNIPVTRLLTEMGVVNLHVVPEQREPDGDFPTVKMPNPEDQSAFDLAIPLARKVNADFIIATDPDSDRMGVCAKDSKGEYRVLSGNQIGLLMLAYKLCMLDQRGTLPKDGKVVKSIVSTPMADVICKKFGVDCDSVLTGFRFIGERINNYLEHGGTFLFGFEESYGYLNGTHVRDKDAISASMMMAETALYFRRAKDFSPFDALDALYNAYGFHFEKVGSFSAPGMDGMERIAACMSGLREEPPQEIAGLKLVAVSDYSARERVELASGARAKLELPQSNVLYFELTDGCAVCIRPSGTEPKVKFYIFARGSGEAEANARLAGMYDAVHGVLSAFING